MHTGFRWRNLRERDNLVGLSLGGNTKLWILNKSAGKAWAGFVWPMIGISGRLL